MSRSPKCKREMFVQEYLVDFNATEAAIRCGYSRNGARQTGYEILRRPETAALLREAIDARSKRVGVNADTVLRELVMLATSDLADLFDDAGRMKPVKQLPEVLRRSIGAFEVQEGEEGGQLKRVKLWDKPRALELLAKHLGLLRERVQLEGADGKPIKIVIDLGGTDGKEKA